MIVRNACGWGWLGVYFIVWFVVWSAGFLSSSVVFISARWFQAESEWSVG